MATPKELFAYADTFAGLIPCIVVGVKSYKNSEHGVTHSYVVCEITATRGAYKKGELVALPYHKVWPRDVSRPKRGSYGQTWIVGKYSWQGRLKEHG